MPNDSTAATTTSPTTLYRHDKRPEWGLGVCVETGDDSFRFAFEHGGLRKLARSHKHMLTAVDVPADRAESTIESLARDAGIEIARETLRREGADVTTLEDQLRLFTHLYPDGFDDETWKRDVRGEGKGRSKKAHRAPAITQAQELLGEETLRAALAAGQYHDVVERAVKVLETTSLVTKSQLEPLRSLAPGSAGHPHPGSSAGHPHPGSKQRQAAEAIVELLYGGQRIELRLLQLVQPLGRGSRAASWQLATALPALVHPGEYLFVHPSSVRQQAKWMAPRLTMSKTPDGRQYGRLLRMARSLLEKLREHGLTPRDLMDVHDFMWATLRPAARKLLDQIPPAPPESGVALR